MKLSELLNEDNIVMELRARDKKSVLEELVEAVLTTDAGIEKQSLVRVLLERERLGSTGIGDGVAIPHGKYHGTSRPLISFGRSRSGLDFDSMDGQPTHLFFLLVAPENAANIHLKVLATIARILKNSSFRKALMEAPSSRAIYDKIVQYDEEI